MAVEYLLTSEEAVKSLTNVSDNLSGKYLQSSIREAQETALRGILGARLLSALKEKMADGTLSGDYKDLVDQCQYFLAYTAIVDVAMKASYKISNFGVMKSNDENLSVASLDEIVSNQGYYQAKADARCYDLQTWLLENKDKFEELDECACERIRSNLRSAATSGVWLGGARGRMYNPCKKVRR